VGVADRQAVILNSIGRSGSSNTSRSVHILLIRIGMLFRVFVGLVLCLNLATASARDAICADSKDTIEERNCMSAQVDKVEQKLVRYIDAAKERISEDKNIALSLDEAQKAWLSYRLVHCGDVYKYWFQGTYRYRASLQCMLDLTQERTHDIWSAYLTYTDSNDGVLPEP
jgi:uncharacterized protein YecT (DUF1311 family)